MPLSIKLFLLKLKNHRDDRDALAAYIQSTASFNVYPQFSRIEDCVASLKYFWTTSTKILLTQYFPVDTSLAIFHRFDVEIPRGKIVEISLNRGTLINTSCMKYKRRPPQENIFFVFFLKDILKTAFQIRI